MPFSGRARRETAKGRNRTRNADFCRFSLIFGSLCKSRDLGVADLRRKPQIFAENRRFLQKPVSPICCLPVGDQPINGSLTTFGGGVGVYDMPAKHDCHHVAGNGGLAWQSPESQRLGCFSPSYVSCLCENKDSTKWLSTNFEFHLLPHPKGPKCRKVTQRTRPY